jgi:tRNA pseudouridine38-40 synthase
VQDTLEKALRIFAPGHGGLVGCGRTDTGVHARDYYAHFEVEEPVRDDLAFKLNQVLPRDIAVFSCTEVSEKLHARFAATERTYKYYLHFSKNPFSNQYSVYQNRILDLDKMNAAAALLLGSKDFSSFSRSQTQVKTNMCNVMEAFWEPIDNGAVFTIKANRFLRNMVRAIVGTMILIGEGKLSPEAISAIIESRNRSEAGKSAHAQGLFLHHIYYPQFHVASIR